MMNTTITTIETINAASYKELQSMAKMHKIKANQKADALRKALIALIPVEEKEEDVMDEKRLNGEKLAKMLVGAWVYQSTHKYNGLMLFFNSTKYQGKMIASRKRLMKVTGDVITVVFGEKYNKYNVILEAYKLMANYGFCTVSDKDVSMTTDQWNLCVAQYNKLQQNAKANGCNTLSEYILK